MKNFKVASKAGRARVTVGEKLTAGEVPALQPLLRKEIGAGTREIVVDLAHTTALDSTGIGLLIATTNSLAAVQGAIRVVNVSPAILKLLRSMRLADRLHASAAGTEASHG